MFETIRNFFRKPLVDPIEHNECILHAVRGVGYFGIPTKTARQLIEHPTIRCYHPRCGDWPGGPGPRLAVWRRDMSYPECRSCHVEDPNV